MAIVPFGAPQPVKLAIAPLAAAQEVVRLTQEQNQRIRESRLEVDDDVARDARRAADAAREVAREKARERNADQNADQPANDTVPRNDTRGETVDIVA